MDGKHMSVGKPGILFVSDQICNFLQINANENKCLLFQSCVGAGFHTVIQNGDPYFTDGEINVINTKEQDNKLLNSLKQRTGNH